MRKTYQRLLAAALTALGFGAAYSCKQPETDIEELYACPITEYNDSITDS